jgi:hypothetical protein
MLLIDFCNVKEWSIEEIRRLYEEHRIIHTDYGHKRGWEYYCASENDIAKRFYFSDNKRDLAKGLKKEVYANFILPGNDEYAVLWSMLEKSQAAYKLFLDKCIVENLDLEFINSLFEKRKICFTENQENKWIPKISLGHSYNYSIEEYIDWEIISIIYNAKKNSPFGRIKKCNKCQNYFVYVRPSKKFCSDKCRYGLHNKLDTESGKRREFMKMGRSQGKYQ